MTDAKTCTDRPTAKQQLVLDAITAFAERHGVFPGTAAIARRLGITPKRVRERLLGLIKKGHVRRAGDPDDWNRSYVPTRGCCPTCARAMTAPQPAPSSHE